MDDRVTASDGILAAPVGSADDKSVDDWAEGITRVVRTVLAPDVVYGYTIVHVEDPDPEC